jgi:hypothetical protein
MWRRATCLTTVDAPPVPKDGHVIVGRLSASRRHRLNEARCSSPAAPPYRHSTDTRQADPPHRRLEPPRVGPVGTSHYAWGWGSTADLRQKDVEAFHRGRRAPGQPSEGRERSNRPHADLHARSGQRNGRRRAALQRRTPRSERLAAGLDPTKCEKFGALLAHEHEGGFAFEIDVRVPADIYGDAVDSAPVKV